MPAEVVSYTANGNISPSRFVSITAGADFKVDQCIASGVPVGISGQNTEQFDSVYHATAGHTCRVFGLGEIGWLQLGGTVSAGDFLGPDSTGQGVTVSLTATAHDDLGARALMSGYSGEQIRAQVVAFSGPQSN